MYLFIPGREQMADRIETEKNLENPLALADFTWQSGKLEALNHPHSLPRTPMKQSTRRTVRKMNRPIHCRLVMRLKRKLNWRRMIYNCRLRHLLAKISKSSVQYMHFKRILTKLSISGRGVLDVK